MRAGHTFAPPAERMRGSWEETLNIVSKLLTCAYRLGRQANLLEAYQPCTLQECKLLQKHHSQWSANVTHSLKNLSVRDTQGAPMSSTASSEETCRTRCVSLWHDAKRLFTTCHQWLSFHNMPPVVIVRCGIRDAAKYGRVDLHSLDTTFFSHARFGPRLLEHVLGADSSHGAVQRTLDHCHSFIPEREESAKTRGSQNQRRRRRRDKTP